MKFYASLEQINQLYNALQSANQSSKFCCELKIKGRNIIESLNDYRAQNTHFLARKDMQFLLSRNHPIDFVSLCTLALAEGYVFNTHDSSLDFNRILDDALMFVLRHSHQVAFVKLVKITPELQPLLGCVKAIMKQNPNFIESARMIALSNDRNKGYYTIGKQKLSLFAHAKDEIAEGKQKLSNDLFPTERAILATRPWLYSATAP